MCLTWFTWGFLPPPPPPHMLFLQPFHSISWNAQITGNFVLKMTLLRAVANKTESKLASFLAAN